MFQFAKLRIKIEKLLMCIKFINCLRTQTVESLDDIQKTPIFATQFKEDCIIQTLKKVIILNSAAL